MNTSAWVTIVQNKWLPSMTSPKRNIRPAPAKRKLGSTKNRAASISPIARDQKNAIGA